MTYDEFRRSVKTGDMLLWQSKPTGNLRHDTEIEAVQVSTESPWTHVGIAWVEYGRAWAMDLTVTGCAPRLLSNDPPQAWINAPRRLSRAGLLYAFSRFGKMRYSRWQAILGYLRRLAIGNDMLGQCAEYVIEVYREGGMAPSEIATPAACVEGALLRWSGAALRRITKEAAQ